MALHYYLFEYSDPRQVLTWHVGESKNSLNECSRQCNSIQADGDELEYIRRNFSNLPIPNHQKVVRWSGEMAAFIAMNL